MFSSGALFFRETVFSGLKTAYPSTTCDARIFISATPPKALYRLTFPASTMYNRKVTLILLMQENALPRCFM